MNRRFVLVTLALTATAAFLVGLIVAGSLTPTTADSDNGRASMRRVVPHAPVVPAGGVNFADIAERINPSSPTCRGATTAGNPEAWRDSLREDESFFGSYLLQAN